MIPPLLWVMIGAQPQTMFDSSPGKLGSPHIKINAELGRLGTIGLKPRAAQIQTVLGPASGEG